MEFYRGFNVSWTEADKYFDPPSSINKDWLKPCVETRLMITKAGFDWKSHGDSTNPGKPKVTYPML